MSMHASCRRVTFVVGLFGAMAASVCSAEPDALRESLIQFAKSEFLPERATGHAEMLGGIWKQMEALPAPERAPWQHTLMAAIQLPIAELKSKGSETLKETDAAADQPESPERVQRQEAARREREAKARAIESAEAYYRALIAAFAEDTPKALRHAAAEALAKAIGRRTRDLPPAGRLAVMKEGMDLRRAAIAFWRAEKMKAWEAVSLAELALDQFTSGVEEEETPELPRPTAIRIYETLPDDFLELVDLALDEPLAQRLTAFATSAYERQADTYLLQALAALNLSRNNPESASESVFLFAESLRVAMVHRYVSGISNVGALLVRPGIGEQTGKASKVQELQKALQQLSSIDANPHWRSRVGLAETEQAFRWIHARAGQYLGQFYAETGQLLRARHQLDIAEQFAADLDDAAILPLVVFTKTSLLVRAGLASAGMQKARESLTSKNSLRERADTLLLMARIAHDQHDLEHASDYVQWAMDLFVKPGSFRLNRSELGILSRVRATAADLEFRRGRLVAADRVLGEAVSLAAIEEPDDAFDLELRRLSWEQTRNHADRYRPSARLLAAIQSTPSTPVLAVAQVRGAGARVRIPDWEERPSGPDAAAGKSRNGLLTTGQWALLQRQFANGPKDAAAANSGTASEAASRNESALAELERRMSKHEQTDLRRARRAALDGNLDEAMERFQAALDLNWKVVTRDLDPTLGIESLEQDRQLHHAAAVLAVRLGEPARAMAILDMPRHRATAEAVARSGRGLWASLSYEERNQARELDEKRTRAAEAVVGLSQARRLAAQLEKAQQAQIAAEGEWQDFLSTVRARHRVLAPARSPLTREQIGELLRNGEAILVLSVGESETCAVLAKRQNDRVTFTGRVLEIFNTELDSLVEALRVGCADAAMPFDVLARELDEILYQPFAAELEQVELLAVAADGVLNKLPFAVLQDQRQRYLADRHAVAMVPSLQLLMQSRAARPAARSGALLVDLQTFENRIWIPSSYAAEIEAAALRELLPRFQLAALAHTKREGDRLVDLFGKEARRLSDVEAQETAVIRAASGKRYVHFSTHGLVDPYNPFQSVLVLAEPLGETGDGYLEANEILESGAFFGTDLVTLSTCESGLGLVQGTEGVLGLTWAFLGAGSRSVVSSLWSVDDAATADFMVHFYGAILADKDKAQSLQAAGRFLRSKSTTNHPAYWAPYQIMGDWRSPPD